MRYFLAEWLKARKSGRKGNPDMNPAQRESKRQRPVLTRLKRKLAAAPHERWCMAHPMHGGKGICTCWKAED